MADRIKLLPEAVANQIAAGEVVNRPASVVKEMLENAVDAGAKNITVNFRDGGKALIQIIDDGCGMSSVDARLAFDRHATSKITDVEDIYKLTTFGFRGEALASIASVAEVELRTRREADELGTKVEICGGKFADQSPVNSSVGSQFLIKNLFYNVPARRRFLEKSTTEARHIIAEYQRVALCNPDVAFTLYDNDSLLSKLPASSLRQRVVGVIGKNIAKNLLDLNAETSIVKLEGFVGRPASAKQNNKEQFMFVNGRYFKSAYFHKAIVSAYEKLIPANTQPSYFLYLTVEPERIDVNVHPQKTEVKFSDGADMWSILNAATRESLAKSGAVPGLDFELDTSVEIPVFREDSTVYKTPTITSNPDFNPFVKYRDADTPKSSGGRAERADISDLDESYDSRGFEPSGEFSDGIVFESGVGYDESVLEFISGGEEQQQLGLDTEQTACGDVLAIGQKHFATVVDGSLVLIDIRRACEAVLYDRYITMLGSGNSVSQQLLFPEKLTMSIDDISLLQEQEADFAAFGFDLRFVDEHSVEIQGLPADFTSTPTEELIYELLDSMRDQTGSHEEIRRKRLAAAMARTGSYARSRNTGKQELKALAEQLGACGNSAFTPSGNKVMTALSAEDIAKMLK